MGNVTDTFVKLDASTWARSQSVYDAVNRLSISIDPEDGATYYTYDEAGNQLTTSLVQFRVSWPGVRCRIVRRIVW